ncbi:MAG TPA: hypothetical protein VJ772_05180 [Nitrososphaeraceae archaeon]|jgi:hypothetical protein|nr:hypothetical protein [Nitrososphaeraceae archaeon]
MGKETYFVFSVVAAFILICIPSITFAQWPITADPSLAQNDVDVDSSGNSNQTLPSINENISYSGVLP